jgi:hypothetical protein
MQSIVTPHSVDRILAHGDRANEDALDDVYRKYRSSHPFLPVTHFIDHSTMGPEALVALGLGDKVMDWISHHRVRPYDAPSVGVSISSAWTEAIGRKECHGDWLRHFESELNASPYEDFLALWIERFAHDVGAFLFHGLIRTAHAARALQHKDTPERRGELARGLALWAIGIKSAPPNEPTDRAAGADPIAGIMHCARAGAATFVRKSTIPNLHLVTGPMAFMMVAHHLNSRVHDVAATAFRLTHARAIKAMESSERDAHSEPIPSFDQTHLAALAENTDAHPIKLTEAALRAYQATGDDLFLKAAGKVQNYGFWRALVG